MRENFYHKTVYEVGKVKNSLLRAGYK